ncbi:NUDIX hydrolase [Peribacillus butanolivorans]|uniref:NUDIX hydrolase n=1 Tax=Peribacillus butanolivorans TaxID=421767 RepID=UPI0037F9A7AC
MLRVDVAYAFIYKEDEHKILMVNNKGGTWSLPGGAVEQGETLKQAVIRETKEETGLTIEVEEVVAVNEAIFKEKGHHALFITFKAKIVDGEISIQDKDEISEIVWIDIPKANELMPYHPNGVESLLKSSSPYIFQA